MADETVATEEKPKTFAEHYEAAKKAQSADQAPAAPPADDTNTTTPPAEETEPEGQPQEPGEEESILTDEELNLLSAKEKALAVKWQAKLTQRSQKLAEDRRQWEARAAEYEPWKDWIKAMSTDPHSAVRAMAKHLGITVAEAEAAVQQQAEEMPDAVRTKLEALEVETRKIRAEQEAARAEAIAAETNATIEAFRAKHNFKDDKAWAKHEKKMLEVGAKILPAGGVMDTDYLDILHNLVTLGQTRAEQTRDVIAKLNKSAEAAETPKAGLSDAHVVVKRPPAAEITIESAFAAAKRGERWE